MLKFVVGLTDNIDYDGFIYDKNFKSDVSVLYNIQKPTTEIEKATLEWEIDTSIDAVINALTMWEQLIRIPHLCMINVGQHTFEMMPSFKECYLDIGFLNLIPFKSDIIKHLTDSDYSKLTADTFFGDLCIHLHDNSHIANSTILTAYHSNDISLLSDATVRSSVFPKFYSNFNLRGNKPIMDRRYDKSFINWIEEHKDVIISKGYDINSNRILNYGHLVIGKLLTDFNTTYENLIAYPRICRTSFVKIE